MNKHQIQDVYSRYGFTSTWDGDKEIEPKRKLYRENDVKALKAYYKEVNGEFDKAFDKILQDNDFDADEKTATFSFAGMRPVEVRILPERARNERAAIREKARDAYLNSFIEQKQNEADVTKAFEKLKDHRDTPTFFADVQLGNQKVLSGTEIVKVLTSDDYTPEKKNDIFRHYLNQVMDKVNEYSQPCSDEEFIKNFSKMDALSNKFMLANLNINQSFREIAGCELEKGLHDQYDAYCSYAQQLYRNAQARITRMCDSSYEYFSDKDIDKLGATLNESNEYYEYNAERIKIVPVRCVDDMARKNGAGANPLESLKALKLITTYDVMCGEKGPIDDKEANKLLQKEELIGVRTKDGILKAVGYDENNRAFSQNIDENFNKQERFKDLLGIMNKGTRWYNKSSPEYAKMREDLGKLVKGDGDDLKLIASIKESAGKYLENHQFKDKISDIANIRKNCVEEMLKGLKSAEINLTVGANLKKHETALENISTEKAAQIKKEIDFKKRGGGIINDANSDKIFVNKPVQKESKNLQNDMGSKLN